MTLTAPFPVPPDLRRGPAWLEFGPGIFLVLLAGLVLAGTFMPHC